jgi:hypothetical protein
MYGPATRPVGGAQTGGENQFRIFEPPPPPVPSAPLIVDPLEPTKPRVSSAPVDVTPASKFAELTLTGVFTESIFGQIITKPKITVVCLLVVVFLLILVIRKGR